MTVELYDAGNSDGLFDLIGKAFKALGILNTSRATTVPAAVATVLSIFENLATPTIGQQQAIAGLPAAVPAFQSSGSGLAGALQQYVQQYLIETVHADAILASKTLQNALAELIRQMIANSESVDASAVAITVTPAGSNTGDGVVLASTKRGDGLVNEYALAETLDGVVTGDGNPLSAGITITGEVAASALLGQDWPLGSGSSLSLQAVDASSNLLANSDFEDEDDLANAPDDWILDVATVGTTLLMTDVEVQTVTISGGPGSGYYYLHFTDKSGKVQTTSQIPWNATAAQVQSALNALDHLSAVTVSSTGTTPNFAHTVTFRGYGGNITQLTSTNRLNAGSIAHATTSGGTPQVYAGGKALVFASDGSEVTAIYQRMTNLSAETPYAVSMWVQASAAIAAGVLKLELIDGIGGSIINDSNGVANALTFNASSLTTSWQHLKDLVSGECVFRLPLVVPPLVYFRLRISTAVTNARSIFFDHLAMAQMRQLYNGGPFVAAFTGAAAFKLEDSFTIAVTNDRAGLVGEYMNRNFSLAQNNLLIPSNDSAGETIPDTVAS